MTTSYKLIQKSMNMKDSKRKKHIKLVSPLTKMTPYSDR